jgi:hypothetical protein
MIASLRGMLPEALGEATYLNACHLLRISP